MSGNHASKAMKMQVMTYLKVHPESTANMIYGSGEFKCSSSHIKKVLRILSDEGKVQTVGPNKRNRMFVLSEQDSEPTDEPQNVAISKAKLQSRGEADNSDYFRKVKIWFAINIKLNAPYNPVEIYIRRERIPSDRIIRFIHLGGKNFFCLRKMRINIKRIARIIHKVKKRQSLYMIPMEIVLIVLP